MSRVSNARYSALYGLALLIIAALIFFWLSRGTQFYHFAAGLVVSVLVLVVAKAAFEGVWQAAACALRALGLRRS
jgi:polyferredoxin